MKNLPKKILHIYIIAGILISISLILGAATNKPELYMAFPIGGITALINVYLLSEEVYRMVYIKENVKSWNPFGYFIRMAVFVAAMLLVVKITKKYYPDKMSGNIIFTGLGFMIFKISLFISRKIKK